MTLAYPLNLHEIAKYIAERFTSSARTKGLEFTYSVAADIPALLRGDEIKLRQILANLVANAIKFTGKGTVAVRINKEGETDSDVKVCLLVTDTGIGIPPKMHPTLFQPLAQVGGAANQKYGSAGLGLPTCKQLAELMGGEIGFDSAPGKGSTFWCKVRLGKQPLPPRPGPPPAPPAYPAPPAPAIVLEPPSPTRRLKRFSVLIASPDQKLWAQMLVEIHKLGYEATAATTCQEALLSMSSFPYGLVLVDSSLPEKDIFSSVADIRNQEKGKLRTPILALLDIAHQGARARFLDAGLDDAVDKPVRPAALASILARWDVPIDPAMLAALRGLNHNSIADTTMQKFKNETPVALSDMREALKAKNMQAFKQEAKLLKAASAVIGAKGMRALSSKAEMLDESCSTQESSSLLKELEEEFQRAQAMLQEQAPSSNEGSPAAVETPTPKPSLKGAGAKRKILLCDDDMLLTSLIAHILEQMQCSVLMAHDGEEGLALVRKEKPDLLILDLGMPVKSGISVLEDLRKNKEEGGLPYVIILSNYESPKIVALAKEMGANEVLTKPIAPTALRKKIEGLIAEGKI